MYLPYFFILCIQFISLCMYIQCVMFTLSILCCLYVICCQLIFPTRIPGHFDSNVHCVQVCFASLIYLCYLNNNKINKILSHLVDITTVSQICLLAHIFIRYATLSVQCAIVIDPTSHPHALSDGLFNTLISNG